MEKAPSHGSTGERETKKPASEGTFGAMPSPTDEE